MGRRANMIGIALFRQECHTPSDHEEHGSFFSYRTVGLIMQLLFAPGHLFSYGPGLYQKVQRPER